MSLPRASVITYPKQGRLIQPDRALDHNALHYRHNVLLISATDEQSLYGYIKITMYSYHYNQDTDRMLCLLG